MRTWVKVSIWGAAVVALGIAALGGTAAYFVLRHMETRAGTEAQAAREIEAVKARFGSRAPLVEIVDPRRGDVRINRATTASAAPVETLHVINWKSDTGELSRTEMPVWLMRFSTVNILSQLGVAPAKFRLTVNDVEQYGPGVIVDYDAHGAFRIFVWVE